jgi:hypothetical protein
VACTLITHSSGDTSNEPHSGILRDYAYPGSESVIQWFENDRRNFRGDWQPCTAFPGCILPAYHRGRHAT